MAVNKNEICFIAAWIKGDYFFEGIRKMGYRIIIPYKDYNLLFRCMREAWFRLRFPFKKLWFNSQIKNIKAKVFVVEDSLIVPELLSWIKQKHPSTRIILSYENRADRTINPDLVDETVAEKWSYDEDDCIKYNMKLKPGGYLEIWKNGGSSDSEYDILYVGRDKGRAKKIFALENEFKAMGLRTYIHICADRKFWRFKHRYYKPLLTYEEYINLLQKSKAVMNIVPSGQSSITLREYEAVFFNIKCITNNQAIKNWELYHPSRFFILGNDKIEYLCAFLNSSFIEVEEQLLERYKYEHYINDIICL